MPADENDTATDAELWARLGGADGHDRVELLELLGERSRDRAEFAQAAALFAEIASIWDEAERTPEAGYALQRVGWCLFGNREFDESAAAYADSAARFAQAGRSVEAAHVLWLKAEALRMGGDLEACLAAANESRQLAQAEQEWTIAGESCYEAARALYWLDRETEAYDACGESRDFFRLAGQPLRVMAVDDFALTVTLFLGDLERALELAVNCYVLARASSTPHDDAYAMRRLAETHRRRGEYSAAIELAERARERYRDDDDLLGVAQSERVRAQTLLEVDEPEAALAVFTDARVLFDATGDDYGAFVCDARRSIVLHGLGRYEEAARLNRQLAQGLVSAGSDLAVELGWTIARLADNLIVMGDGPACLAVVDEWGPRLAAEGERLTAPLLALRASRARALDAVGEAEAAVAQAEEVLALTTSAEVSQGTAYCYELRARALLAAGDPSGEKELAHAIALHLADGDIDRARRLSQSFMPDIDQDARQDRLDSRTDDTAPGHGPELIG
ncbi:MAG: tetratricopeptide repeat protein [Actinobacteria bacterium]|nr:MAG: tetratricopeptide repeat protein [Actinomycetota bacterium]